MGHIRLSREADLVVVAPATADLIAKMATGCRRSRLDRAARDRQAGPDRAGHEPADVAASGDPAQSRALGPTASARSAPNPGDMACGEVGIGRMAEPEQNHRGDRGSARTGDRNPRGRPGAGDQRPDRRGDRSGALHRQSLIRQAGPRDRRRVGRRVAEVTLVSGPVHEPDPAGVRVVGSKPRWRCSRPARRRCRSGSRCARRRWPTGGSAEAGARSSSGGRSARQLWCWRTIRTSSRRWPTPGSEPAALVIGFAAETENVVANARRKLAAKGCDWIVANDVSKGRRHLR